MHVAEEKTKKESFFSCKPDRFCSTKQDDQK